MPRFNLWEFLFKGGDDSMLRGRKNTSTQTNTRERLQQMHDVIAKKAYELYEKRGCQHGNDLNDWLYAERIVKRGMRSRNR